MANLEDNTVTSTLSPIQALTLGLKNILSYFRFPTGSSQPTRNRRITGEQMSQLIGSVGAMSVTFNTDTSGANPGSGKVALDNATQNASTHLYVETSDSYSTSWANAVTAAYLIVLSKFSDPRNQMIFKVTSVAALSGYKRIFGSVIWASTTNPFANNDLLRMRLDTTGDVNRLLPVQANKAGWSFRSDGSQLTLTTDFPTVGRAGLAYADIRPDNTGSATANSAALVTKVANWADSTHVNYKNDIIIPAGINWLTSPVQVFTVHNGIRIRGQGAGASLRYVSDDTTFFPAFQIQESIPNTNSPIGYVDGYCTLQSSNVVRIHIGIDTVTDITGEFALHDCVIIFDDSNATDVPANSHSQLFAITAKTAAGGGAFDYTLSGTVTTSGRALKWIKSSRLVASISGQVLTMTTSGDTANFVAGQDCWLTDGAAIKDLRGEHVRIAAINSPSSGQITLTKAPALTYNGAQGIALVGGPNFLHDFQLHNLTIGYNSAHGIFNGEFHNCHWPLLAGGGFGWNMGAVDDLRFYNCIGYYELNNGRNMTWYGGRVEDMVAAESSGFLSFYGTEMRGRFYAGDGLADILMDGCDCWWNPTGSGANFIQFNNGFQPTHRVKIRNSKLNTNTGELTLPGDDSEVSNCTLAAGFAVGFNGLNNIVHDNKGAGVIILYAGSSGKLGANSCVIDDRTGGAWQQVLGAPTAMVGKQTLSSIVLTGVYTTDAPILQELVTDTINLTLTRQFSPVFMQNIWAWLRPGVGNFQNPDGTTAASADSTAVGYVTDQSGFNDHVNQSTSGSRPLLRTGANGFNGSHSVWSFDGSNDFFDFINDLNIGDGDFYFLTAVQPTDHSAAMTIIGSDTSGHDYGLLATTGLQQLNKTFVAGVATGSNEVVTTGVNIIGIVYRAGVVQFWRNGAPDGAPTTVDGAFSNPALYIGCVLGNSQFFKGKMGEIVIGSGTISDDDFSKGMKYLNSLYAAYTDGVDPLLIAAGSYVVAGTSSGHAKVGGAYFDHYADGSSTHTDGTEDTLYSDAILANTLNANGAKIDAQYNLTFVGSATATRKVKVKFAGTTVLDSGAQTYTSGGTADVSVTIIRETSSVVRVRASFIPSGATLQPTVTYTRVTGLTLTSNNNLDLIGAATGTGAASADIVAKIGRALWHPAA